HASSVARSPTRRSSDLPRADAPPRHGRGPRMTRYEFRVEGRLTQEARTAIGAMRITEVPPETVLDGEVVDESHLHGIIVQLQALDRKSTRLNSSHVKTS